MRQVTFFFSFVFIFCSMGCVRDKNYDDYQEQRLKEDLSKVQEVRGLYSGKLVSSKNNESLGQLFIEIQEDTQVSNLKYETPVLTGKVLFRGSTQVRLIFHDSYYNAKTHTFKSTLKVPAEDGATTDLDLKGTWDGKILKGSIQIFGYEESAATFELQKLKSDNAEGALDEMDDENAPPDNTTNAVDVIDEEFTGRAYNIIKKKEIPFSIKVSNLLSTPDKKFVDLFSPKRRVHITLTFYYTDFTHQNAFQEGEWDEGSHALSGRGHLNSPFDNDYTINCLVSGKKPELNLGCHFVNTFDNIIQDFTATEKP